MSLTTERICPYCQQPFQPGDNTKLAIYKLNRDGIPISEQVHYPDCYRAINQSTAQVVNLSAVQLSIL